MAIRIKFARALERVGAFIQSSAVAIMRPSQLVEFSRLGYARTGNVEAWSSPEIIDAGLDADEQSWLECLPKRPGHLLLLGLGGGREAIPLARKGFEITGVDFVPDMVERAILNAEKRGVKIKGLVQEISRLQVPQGSFDVVWLSNRIYSCVPTRKKRVQFLKRIGSALKPGGTMVCSFFCDPKPAASRKAEWARKILAFMTLGNFWLEPGDRMWQNLEFIHAFSSVEALKEELAAGGFTVSTIVIPDHSTRGAAILFKPLPKDAKV